MATPPRTGGTSATGGYATTGGCRFPVVSPRAEGPAAPGPSVDAGPARRRNRAARGRGPTRRTTPPFLAAAAASGAVSHPVLARVYDAAVEDRPDGQAHLAHVGNHRLTVPQEGRHVETVTSSLALTKAGGGIISPSFDAPRPPA